MMNVSASSRAGMVVILGMSAVVLCLLAILLGRISLNDDAGYFLPLARAMLDGQWPYLDVFSWHTPLGPVFLMPLARLVPDTLIWAAPVYMAAWNLLSALLIGRMVTRNSDRSWWPGLLAGGFFLGMAALTDGYYVTLEPIYLALLLGSWTLLEGMPRPASGWVAGLLAGLAIMVKQFAGVGFLALLPLAIRHKHWKAYLAGSAVVLAMIIGVFWVKGVSPMELIAIWINPPGTAAYLGSSLNWLTALMIFLPLLLWGIGGMKLSRPSLQHIQTAFLGNPMWPGLFGFLVVWLLGTNWQYLLPLAGWGIAGAGNRINKAGDLWRIAAMMALTGLLVITVAATDSSRTHQLDVAAQVEAAILPEEDFLIMGHAHQYLYALTSCQPPLLQEAGYQIYPMLEPDVQTRVLDSAEVVLDFLSTPLPAAFRRDSALDAIQVGRSYVWGRRE